MRIKFYNNIKHLCFDLFSFYYHKTDKWSSLKITLFGFTVGIKYDKSNI
jgi:hypothetical protein